MSDKNLINTFKLSAVSEKVYNKIKHTVSTLFGDSSYFVLVPRISNFPVSLSNDDWKIYNKYMDMITRDEDELRVEVYSTLEPYGRLAVLIIQTGEGYHKKDYKVLHAFVNKHDTKRVSCELDENAPQLLRMLLWSNDLSCYEDCVKANELISQLAKVDKFKQV